MFCNDLSAHSLLTNLVRWGWLMRMRLAWKKSQKTLEHQKDYIEIRHEAPGARAKEPDPIFAIIGPAARDTWRRLAGVWHVPARWRLQPGLKILVSPRPKEEVFKVFEPKRVDSLLLPWYWCLIMVPMFYGNRESTVLCAPIYLLGDTYMWIIGYWPECLCGCISAWKYLHENDLIEGRYISPSPSAIDLDILTWKWFEWRQMRGPCHVTDQN